MDGKSVLIFGAGRIGRSFIGQLFGKSGYEVIFIDINQALVDELNRRKSYPIVIKGKAEETILIRNVRAVSSFDTIAVKREIAQASIMAIAIGKNALGKIIPIIAEGLEMRQELYSERPMNIIIAENMRSAGEFIRSKLLKHLSDTYPLDRLVGLVETSIGKMVPIMTENDLMNDPLQIFAEPYNTLIFDKRGYIGQIPDINGFNPKENIKAWVDRKAFIHNLGHATVAYIGNYYCPEKKYIFEVLANNKMLETAQTTMLQAAEILVSYYSDDFTFKDLEEHVVDLLIRFQNRALKDTVFRVGQDLPRKLGIDDRFSGIIKMAQKRELKYDHIVFAMAHGFFFRRTDDYGRLSACDEHFFQVLKTKGIENALVTLCGFHSVNDKKLINELKYYYQKLKDNK